MIIDCSSCEYHETEHCDDCFVRTVLMRKPGDEVLVLDPDEEEAIAALTEAGLVPVIRFKKKAV